MSGFSQRAKQFSRIGNPYLSSEMKISEAMAQLKARGVKLEQCPRCTVQAWNVDLVEIPARSTLTLTSGIAPWLAPGNPDEGVISLLAIACGNCGYTMFHNLELLGSKVGKL